MERAVDQQGLESDERSRAPAIPPGGVVLAVCVLLGVFAFFRVCFAAGSVVQTLGIATSDAEVADLGLAARAFSGVPLLAVYLPIIVLFLVWVAKANASARRLGAGGMKISTGWAVGWFLVPFVHLVMSVKVMSELRRASDPDADP
ncbi:MAG: hypothetical protein CMJ31_03095, partial [Phycisphaerae bacterium]|nr:hypothetical protein [Phycisphaerae bacterium]